MILDILAHSSQYTALSPRFQAAFAFLNKFDGTAAPGKYEIDGTILYALVQKYTTKPSAGRQYEAHHKYIDIQYVHAGRETILWAPLPALKTPTIPYDEKSEAAMYALIPDGFDINLSAGMFTILFPGDGHIPTCTWGAPSEVSKVVVKVKI